MGSMAIASAHQNRRYFGHLIALKSSHIKANIKRYFSNDLIIWSIYIVQSPKYPLFSSKNSNIHPGTLSKQCVWGAQSGPSHHPHCHPLGFPKINKCKKGH